MRNPLHNAWPDPPNAVQVNRVGKTVVGVGRWALGVGCWAFRGWAFSVGRWDVDSGRRSRRIAEDRSAVAGWRSLVGDRSSLVLRQYVPEGSLQEPLVLVGEAQVALGFR